MPDRGMRLRIQQTIDASKSAQDDWNGAQTRLASLQATYNGKKTLAEGISSGRQSRSTLDMAKMLDVEIQELKIHIEETKEEIIGYRARMDAAEALFNELEGLEVVDRSPGM